jgi:hypothetical protein
LAEGEPQYDDFEKQLAQFPPIVVPTITLEGDANGAPHPTDPAAYRQKFTGKYENRIIRVALGTICHKRLPKRLHKQ